MNEIWKKIDGFDKYYVSNLGRVKSSSYRNTGKEYILKQRTNKDGYKTVCIMQGFKNPKTYLVHRLVALAFIDNPNNYSDVDHKDRCRDNNSVDNLQWVSHLDNVRLSNERGRDYSYMKGNIPSNSKKCMCVETGEIFESYHHAARRFRELGYKTNWTSIWCCCRDNKPYYWGKFHFKNI